MKGPMCLLAVLPGILILSYGYAVSPVVVSDDWVVAAPPNARVIAGYMTITNNSSRTRTLISVSGENFKRAEIHRTEIHGDIMRMVPQTELEIPAQGAVSLKPGGYHLMLIGPERVPVEGEEVHLILRFDGDETLHVRSPVRRTK